MDQSSSNKYTDELRNTAQAMVARGKGILAADESTPTIAKRFTAINLESTEDSRRAYRELLFTTPGISEYISGVILFDETLRQQSSSGVPFPKLLADEGIIPGIKVDAGTAPMSESSEEKVTQGLDGLAPRLVEYYSMGARFAKWRAVITIGEGIPTQACIDANAELLAEYAHLCQAAGLVPIVEPEVLMDADNDIARCEQVTTDVLNTVFAKLNDKGVMLEGVILKPNMVIAGKLSATQSTPQEVAEATARVLTATVPPAVPGIVFLSGGQSEQDATMHLNLLNQPDRQFPWQLSFSYGRALQGSTISTWEGNPSNIGAAQKVFAHRCQMNSLARDGKYEAGLEL